MQEGKEKFLFTDNKLQKYQRAPMQSRDLPDEQSVETGIQELVKIEQVCGYAAGAQYNSQALLLKAVICLGSFKF